MRDWLGIGLFAPSGALLIAGLVKRRARMEAVVPADAIRPEFAAMGEIARPLILIALAFAGLKMSLLYMVLGGQRFLSPLDFAGFLAVLAAYGLWLVLSTKRSRPVSSAAPDRGATQPPRTVAAAAE
jgi:hypothetical protein